MVILIHRILLFGVDIMQQYLCRFCDKENALVSFTEEEIKLHLSLGYMKYCGSEECRRKALDEQYEIWKENYIAEIEQERKDMKMQGYKYEYQFWIDVYNGHREEMVSYVTKKLNKKEFNQLVDGLFNDNPNFKEVKEHCYHEL